MNKTYSGQKTSSMTVPLFHSLLSHFILICLLITMPLYSGSLNALSIGSLPVFLKDGEGPPEVLYAMKIADTSPSEADDFETPEEWSQEEVVGTESPPADKKASVVSEDYAATAEDVDSGNVARPTDEKEEPSPPVKSVQADLKLLSGDAGGTSNKKKAEIEMAVADATPKQIAKIDAGGSEDIKPVKLSMSALRKNVEEKIPPKDIVAVDKKHDVDPPLQRESLALKKSEEPGPVPLPEEEKGKETAGPDRIVSEVKIPHGIRRASEDAVAEKPKSAPEAHSVSSRPSGIETKKDPLLEENVGQKSKAETEIKTAGLNQKRNILSPERGESGQTDGEKEAGKPKPSGGQAEKIAVSRHSVGQILAKGSSTNRGGENANEKTTGRGLRDTEQTSGPAPVGKGSGADGQQKIGPAVITASQQIIPAKDEKIGLGLPKPEPLLSADIKIEIFLTNKENKLISMYLLKKGYPVPGRKLLKNRKDEINYPLEKKSEQSDPSGVRHIFSVREAEKGTFTFVIDNRGNEACTANAVFRFYEGRPAGRIKEYKAIDMQPGKITRFKFILPDALFWDDKERFSGEIESSTTKTKFLYESGLVWTEDKE